MDLHLFILRIRTNPAVFLGANSNPTVFMRIRNQRKQAGKKPRRKSVLGVKRQKNSFIV